MREKAKTLVFGFSAEELRRIDERLVAIGIPAPTRLEKRHGKIVIGDILRQGKIGEEEFDCDERLVLFFKLSDGGVRTASPGSRIGRTRKAQAISSVKAVNRPLPSP